MQLREFFRKEHVLEAIRQVAEADDVTLMVGAGSSMESGLDSWAELVSGLLRKVGQEHGLVGHDLDSYCEWTISRDGLAGAAASVKASLAHNEFKNALVEGLYKGEAEYTPGETARAVARLRVTLGGHRHEIATTNYDHLLSAALGQEVKKRGLTGQMKPVSHGHPQGSGDLFVRHLHGEVLPSGWTRGTVVLSEAEYHRLQDEGAWQEDYFSQRLAHSTCVFIGTSLTDPNLLRYIYRAGSGLDHLALFVRQQDADLYKSRSKAAAVRERTAQARWETAGVRPIHLDYYSGTAQFLAEVERLRTVGDDYEPLTERLGTWTKLMRRSVLSNLGNKFSHWQKRLNELLRDMVDGIDEHFGDTVERSPGERIGLALWTFDAVQDVLVRRASSDYLMNEPGDLHRALIGWDSQIVAVQAFCSGSLVTTPTSEESATRFNHVVGFPLYLNNDEHGRLPVGAMTLASTKSADASLLGRGLSTLRQTVA
ncbi:MAG: SIR2 family protein, partial [candidate division NC10 bacterium]